MQRGLLKQESMYGLSAKKNDRCEAVAVQERFKQESMYGLSAEKTGRCREVAVVERWPQAGFDCINTIISGKQLLH